MEIVIEAHYETNNVFVFYKKKVSRNLPCSASLNKQRKHIEKESKKITYVVITYGKKSTLELVFEPMTLARQRFESNVLPVNKNLINSVYRKLVD